MMFWVLAALLTALCVGLFWQSLWGGSKPERLHVKVGLLVACTIPALALGLYMWRGSVGMPDMPFQMLHTTDDDNAQALWLQERPLLHDLRRQPDHEKAWLDLIALYLQTDRPALARQAYADALKSVTHPKRLNDPLLQKALSPAKDR